MNFQTAKNALGTLSTSFMVAFSCVEKTNKRKE